MGTPLNSKHVFFFPLTSRQESCSLCSSKNQTHVHKWASCFRNLQKAVNYTGQMAKNRSCSVPDDQVKGKEQSCSNWWDIRRLGFGGDVFVHIMSSKQNQAEKMKLKEEVGIQVCRTVPSRRKALLKAELSVEWLKGNNRKIQGEAGKCTGKDEGQL